jgi:hypothetical protein
MRWYSFRSSWCDPLELVKISTPSRPMRMWGLNRARIFSQSLFSQSLVGEKALHAHLFGVNSSSHSSIPMQVSYVEMTASPKGTVVWGWSQVRPDTA